MLRAAHCIRCEAQTDPSAYYQRRPGGRYCLPCAVTDGLLSRETAAALQASNSSITDWISAPWSPPGTPRLPDFMRHPGRQRFNPLTGHWESSGEAPPDQP